MPAEQQRRPRRNPLSPEEVAEIVALKKRRAHFRLHKFKKTRFYKTFNIFNIVCFFLYFELIFCFYGPCLFERHDAKSLLPKYGNEVGANGEQLVTSIDVKSQNGRRYTFVVDKAIDVPPQDTEFFIGKDFLLRKELKGTFDDEEHPYRLYAASPVLFLCFLALAASFIGFVNNLNEHAYSLSAISVLNGMTMLGILAL